MTEKIKSAAVQQVQSVARSIRTTLATRLLKQGLYAGQDAVMLLLAQEDGLSPGVIATKLGVQPPTITKTITRLEAQGFVRRESSTTDQRAFCVFLTESGKEIIGQIEKSVKKIDKTIFKNFSKKERKDFLKYLARLDHNLHPVTKAKKHQKDKQDAKIQTADLPIDETASDADHLQVKM